MIYACPHCNGILSVRVYAQGEGASGAAGENGALPNPAPFLGRTNTDGRRAAAQRRGRAEDRRQQQASDQHQARRQNGTVCPDHGIAKPSRFGGLYCPMPGDSKNGWCTWSSEKGAA